MLKRRYLMTGIIGIIFVCAALIFLAVSGEPTFGQPTDNKLFLLGLLTILVGTILLAAGLIKQAEGTPISWESLAPGKNFLVCAVISKGNGQFPTLTVPPDILVVLSCPKNEEMRLVKISYQADIRLGDEVGSIEGGIIKFATREKKEWNKNAQN